MKLSKDIKGRLRGYIYLCFINHDLTHDMTIECRGESSGSPSNDSDLRMVSHDNPMVERHKIDDRNSGKLKQPPLRRGML